MRLPGYAKSLLHIAALLLVLAGIGHIHSHMCLDGKEPAMTVHFENVKSLAHHDGETGHVDVENELAPQGLLVKMPDQDAPLFLLMALLLPVFETAESQQYSTSHTSSVIHPPAELLPPLRAPPVLS